MSLPYFYSSIQHRASRFIRKIQCFYNIIMNQIEFALIKIKIAKFTFNDCSFYRSLFFRTFKYCLITFHMLAVISITRHNMLE